MSFAFCLRHRFLVLVCNCRYIIGGILSPGGLSLRTFRRSYMLQEINIILSDPHETKLLGALHRDTTELAKFLMQGLNLLRVLGQELIDRDFDDWAIKTRFGRVVDVRSRGGCD
ncbi:hypothetical protein E6O75_ATG02900 [Venturia nashicola]|uniref:Uncharacterized protein n=1 Tax=Venturia nashicola TaxID=86259 RepID=A0A4Z1P8D9_9PEZI|nr:hypothetical protein E6O75_ATG02900 [Venturia nashicola]